MLIMGDDETMGTKPPLHASLKRLEKVDLKSRAAVLGVAYDGAGLHIPFYDCTYRVSSGTIVDTSGRAPTDAVGQVLCHYIMHAAQPIPDDDRRVTFRELECAGPLVMRFADNTNKLISSTFATRLEELKVISAQMGGQLLTEGHHFDLCFKFNALPNISIYMQFDAAEGPFPAQTTLLFNISAQAYLDMNSLFILGTFLAGRLINWPHYEER